MQINPAQPQRLADKLPMLATCVWCYDGDTIQISMLFPPEKCSPFEIVRLGGIDAAEMRGNDRARAIAATNHLSRLVLNQPVTVVPTRVWRDPFNRIIARIYCGGIDINYVMVRDGFARQLGRTKYRTTPEIIHPDQYIV